jgi:hypothetical protein
MHKGKKERERRTAGKYETKKEKVNEFYADALFM